MRGYRLNRRSSGQKDAGEFLERAGEFLLAREAVHNLPLGLCSRAADAPASLRWGRTCGRVAMRMRIYEAEETRHRKAYQAGCAPTRIATARS